VWQVALPGDQLFTGPWATDDAGFTYFLGTDSAQLPMEYTIVALDSCGRLVWRSSPRSPNSTSDTGSPGIVVAGQRVLFQSGTVDAFDRATGEHLWNTDLDAFAGELLAHDDQASVGPLAVSSDGTAFLTLGTHVKPVGTEYGRSTVLLSIDTVGNPQKLADVTADTGYTGEIDGFVIDAADHLDLLYYDYKGVVGGALTSYARDGSMVFSSAFPCDAGYLGPLAAGSSFVVMQYTRPCGMGLTGSPSYAQPHNYDALAVTLDAANDMYLAGKHMVSGLDATATSRWIVSAGELILSAPLLATGGELFVASLPATWETASMSGPISIVSYDTATGTEVARYPTKVVIPAGVSGPPRPRMLLTAAAQVVFSLRGTVTATAVAQVPDPTAQWPTILGGPDQRNAALGR
jgi:outer membrane protein assembly factor BamB